ncbi:hypothetical protein BOX15_Mlig031472g2, partial [Macrostomum lignano]
NPRFSPVAFPLLLATALSIVATATAARCQSYQQLRISSHTSAQLTVNATSGCSSFVHALNFSTTRSSTGFSVAIDSLQLHGSNSLTIRNATHSQILKVTNFYTSTVGCRHLIVGSGSWFEARLVSDAPPSMESSALLSVAPIFSGDCPYGWRSSGSVCYGNPAKNDLVTFDQAFELCRMLQANLAIDFTSTGTLEALVADSRPYWVGVMEYSSKNTKLYFLTGEPFHMSLYDVPKTPSYCSGTSDCPCVFYQTGSLYRADCYSNFAQLCSAPKGGTPAKFYNPNRLLIYIKEWSEANPSEITLIFRRYWPAFLALFFVVGGSILGYRIYRQRTSRLMARRNQMAGGLPVAAVASAANPPPPPGSYPMHAPAAYPNPMQAPAAYPNSMQPPPPQISNPSSVPQQQPSEPQPPPYNYQYFNNSGYQPDSANAPSEIKK